MEVSDYSCQADISSVYPNSLSLVDVFLEHVRSRPDEVALQFLADGEKPELPMTFSELHKQASCFAMGLLESVSKGDRVLLLFQSSYGFAVSFIGCLYAGVIAVPLPIPSRRERDWARLKLIVDDTSSAIAITSDAFKGRISEGVQKHIAKTEFSVLDYSSLVRPESKFIPKSFHGDDIAFLQYTSGSTGSPKGVIVSHRNLIENQRLLQKGFRSTDESVYVSWLPLFHDMGLIGHFLQSIYIGRMFVFMSPNAFLQKPVRWLRAVSQFGGSISGAPNFAYDLCVDRVSSGDKSGLDLSGWKTAFNGAEPVRQSTLQRFYEAFKECGLKEDSLYPCYGLAESTLIVSGPLKKERPVCITADRVELEKMRVVHSSGDTDDLSTLVSVGQPLIENSVVIVSQVDGRKLSDGEVGEIWVCSPCNALGYWNNNDATEKAFGNILSGEPHGKRYLNTGDLGAVLNKNLFITGRSKDVLIFNGRNIYPQDVEWSSTLSNEALKSGRCAAISSYINHKERLILICELERTHSRSDSLERVVEQIRRVVFEDFSLPVFDVVLVAPSTIPITSSGKIRRRACLEQYEKNLLNSVYRWRDTSELVSVKDIMLKWGRTHISSDFSQDSLAQDIACLGMDSINVVEFCEYMRSQAGLELDYEIVMSSKNLEELIETA